MGHATVAITGIAAGGAGVGRLEDGRAVFVHRTVPGELVDVRVVEEKRRWARAEIIQLRRASPDRRTAPCPHYARCGGCTLEHLEYAAQLRAKGRIVADALQRIAGIDAGVPEVIASPEEFRYRNRISFTLLRPGGGRVIGGFHELNRPGRIVDITEACLLPETPIAGVWGRLRAEWGPEANRLPSGRRLRLTLRGTAPAAGGGGGGREALGDVAPTTGTGGAGRAPVAGPATGGLVALAIEGGYAPGRPEELIERVPGLAAIWHRRKRGGVPKLLAGAERLAESWESEELELSGAEFLQVNRRAAARLEEYVVERAGDVRGSRVVDAYCGVGLHARRLARAGARVLGIEVDERALEEARRGASEDPDRGSGGPGLAAPRGSAAGSATRSAAGAPAGSAQFRAGRVEDLLPEALPADLVILNPPRGGLDQAVPEALRERPPARVLYVSCDPATLARDLGRFGPGFELRSLRCFDLFPQTAHVETVAELANRSGAEPPNGK